MWAVLNRKLVPGTVYKNVRYFYNLEERAMTPEFYRGLCIYHIPEHSINSGTYGFCVWGSKEWVHVPLDSICDIAQQLEDY